MKLLLDTHLFLWYIMGDKRIPPRLLSMLRDPSNQVYLSVVSVWEASIKFHLGKMPLPEPPEVYFPRERERHQILSLPLEENSLAALTPLPPLHRDPFDRMLVCQAIYHDMALVTVDEVLQGYPVRLINLS